MPQRPAAQPDIAGEIVGESPLRIWSLPAAERLRRQLKRVGDQDYFERGIELAIAEDKLHVEPVDISDLYAVEVDFAEDLERANLFV